MKSHVIALAALFAIGFSGTAFAGEATVGPWTTTTGPTAMTDAEMDGVTAGGDAWQITIDLQSKLLDVHQEIIVPADLATAASHQASTGGSGETVPYGIAIVQADIIHPPVR